MELHNNHVISYLLKQSEEAFNYKLDCGTPAPLTGFMSCFVSDLHKEITATNVFKGRALEGAA